MSKAKMSMKGFHELSDGDPEALRELLELYITKTTQQMNQLDKGITSRSTSEVSRIAHAIAGANLMVGVEASVPLLRQLEHCADQGDMAQAKSLFKEIDAQFKALKVELQGMIP